MKLEGDTICLFKQGFGPLHKVMEYEDQWSLGLFLLELKRHREKLLKDYNIATQAHRQRSITTSLAPPRLLMLQVNQGIHKWAPN